MTTERRSAWRHVHALLVLLPLVAVPALAEEQPDTRPVFRHATMVSGSAVQGAGLGVADGMRVAVDPRTGELRQPTARELAILEAQRPKRAVGRSVAVQQIELPDGTVMMPLDPELMSHSVVDLTAGGAALACVDGATLAGAPAAMRPAAAAAER